MRRLPLLVLSACLLTAARAAELPDWTRQIRADHPRLFFNRETWPAVKARAEGAERAWYDRVLKRTDALKTKFAAPASLPLADYGVEAAQAAFVFWMTDDPANLELARRLLQASLEFYEQRYSERKPVNWYSTTRVHWVLAWDWLHDVLPAAERRELMERMVDVLEQVNTVRPRIYRENYSGYTTGFYGFQNCFWYIGCTTLGEGIREEKTREWLSWGRAENLRLLDYRRKACGDDGGSASPTLGYAFGAYPWAEQNFFYTWLSATGQNIAPDWPHSAWLANYVIWNWITGPDGRGLEFGYGDTPHTANRMTESQLYTHLANIRHLYGEKAPEAAALARYLQGIVRPQSYDTTWFIYPFLLTDLETAPPALQPQNLPAARNFENMGQIFMRSGTGPDDTYGLFTCGGALAGHRHYDALNFVIYKHGHQALDTGTRWQEERNGDHLANYFAQTVAHNCVLIHQPDEPPANYWGQKTRPMAPNFGGQNKAVGSELKAFETNERFTYVAGDATACYNPAKVAQVTRQMAFLMPNHFVIYDRVTSTDPEYAKAWLLHPGSEPSIDGGTIRSQHLAGRMFCRTLLPADARHEVVGGPAHEFRTGDINWALQPSENPKAELDEAARAMMGQWRVEVRPGAARADDLFLHVIQVGDDGLTEMTPIALLEDAERVGARVTTDTGVWEIWFNRTGELAGAIRHGDGTIDRPLTAEVEAQNGIMAR